MKGLTFRSVALSATLALSGLGVFVAGGEACATRECIYDATQDFPAGDFVGPDAWESAPIKGTWTYYGPMHDVQVQIPPFANRTIINVQVFLSPSPTPADDIGDNFAEASGNLAEIVNLGTGGGRNAFNGQLVLGFGVYNATCAEYYARVLVVAAPEVDAGAPVDADAGADAGEAGADADLDGGDADAVSE